MISFESFKELLSKEVNKNLDIYNNDHYTGININSDNIYQIIKKINENEFLQFKQLIDITVIDYPDRKLRFDLIYILLSVKLNRRLLIRASIKENEKVESITSLFSSANWYERECYDLFGVQFKNHPDLRRILTDYNFEGYPLRKDFPLTGFTEVKYDDSEKRVVYEPVNLPQEYRDFDFSSPWVGLPNELKGDEKETKDSNDEGS